MTKNAFYDVWKMIKVNITCREKKQFSLCDSESALCICERISIVLFSSLHVPCYGNYTNRDINVFRRVQLQTRFS